MAKQMVFSFREKAGKNLEESSWLLGNKGSQLAEMTRIGVSVPPGFTIVASVCRHYFSNKKKWPQGLEKQVKQILSFIEEKNPKAKIIIGGWQPTINKPPASKYVFVKGVNGEAYGELLKMLQYLVIITNQQIQVII